MADRVVDNYSSDVPDMPEVLQRLLMEALDQGKSELEHGYEIIPFSLLVVGDNLFAERHPGDSVEACYAGARHTVEGARGAAAYVFCYDGYLDTDEGTKDAIIAEGGTPGAPTGYAIGRIYKTDADGKPEFNSAPAYIGPAPNFMADLVDEPDEEEAGTMIDETNATPEKINTVEDGEQLEQNNAESFGEPVKED